MCSRHDAGRIRVVAISSAIADHGATLTHSAYAVVAGVLYAPSANRVPFLSALRGIAISLVVWGKLSGVAYMPEEDPG